MKKSVKKRPLWQRRLVRTTCDGCVRKKVNGEWGVKQCKYCRACDRLVWGIK